MPEKKEKEEKITRIGEYNLDEIYPAVRGGSKKDEPDILDKLLQDKTEETIREYKNLRVKKALKKMQEEIGEEEDKPAAVAEMSPQLVEVLSKMDPETRQQMLPIIQASRSPSAKQDPMVQLLPYITYNAIRQNPNASQIDIVKMVETMSTQLRLGIELGRQNQPPIAPQINSADIISIVKAIADIMKGQQPASGGLDMLTNDVVFNRLEKMGFFGGQKNPAEINSQLAFDAAKFKSEVDLKIAMMHEERIDKREIAEFQAAAEQQKWEVVERVLSGPLGGIINKIGGAAASRIEPSGTVKVSKPIQVPCPNCNYQIHTSSDAKKVICPNCEALLVADQSVEEIQGSKKTYQPSKQQQQSGNPSEVPQ